MKLIEAMKKVKANRVKVADLQVKIASHCANLSHETPVYGVETAGKVSEWLQSCNSLAQESVKLLTAIQRTNLATPVTITLGDHQVTKSIAEWVWRRREFSKIDMETWAKLTDRGLKEGVAQTSTGTPFELKIVRHFDPNQRDKMLAMFRTEPHEIDAALEVVNATTEVVE